jgi:hypothetical protein
MSREILDKPDAATYVMPFKDGVRPATADEIKAGIATKIEPSTGKKGDDDAYKFWSRPGLGYDASVFADKLSLTALKANPSFVNAARQIYELKEGHAATGMSDAQLADYAVDKIRWAQNNIVRGVVNLNDLLRNATPQQKIGLSYAMAAYDHSGTTLAGVGTALYQNLADPSAIASIGAGLVSFGTGTAAGQLARTTAVQGLKLAIREAGKEAVEKVLQQRVVSAAVSGVAESAVGRVATRVATNTAVRAGATAAVASVPESLVQQSVRMTALNANGTAVRQQDGISAVDMGISAAFGAAIGGTVNVASQSKAVREAASNAWDNVKGFGTSAYGEIRSAASFGRERIGSYATDAANFVNQRTGTLGSFIRSNVDEIKAGTNDALDALRRFGDQMFPPAMFGNLQPQLAYATAAGRVVRNEAQQQSSDAPENGFFALDRWSAGRSARRRVSSDNAARGTPDPAPTSPTATTPSTTTAPTGTTTPAGGTTAAATAAAATPDDTPSKNLPRLASAKVKWEGETGKTGIFLPDHKTEIDKLKAWLHRKGTHWYTLWTDVQKTPVAMRVESRPVTAPVFHAVDSFMDSKGLTQAIRDLQEEIIADQKATGGKRINSIYQQFIIDNKAKLDEFQAGIAELREHVVKNFKSIPDRPDTKGNKWLAATYAFWPREYGRYNLLDDQKAALLQHLDNFVDIATDLQNPNGQNLAQMRANITKYWDPVKKSFKLGPEDSKLEDSPIGISAAYQMAHDAHVRLTGRLFPTAKQTEEAHKKGEEALGHKAAVEWLTRVGQSINNKFFSASHSGEIIPLKFAYGKSNFEATYQNDIINSKVTDWGTNINVVTTFFSPYENLIQGGFLHKAVDYFDEMLRRSHTPDKGLINNTPPISLLKDYIRTHPNLKPGTPEYKPDLADFYKKVADMRQAYTGSTLLPGANQMWDRFFPNRQNQEKWMIDSFIYRLAGDWAGDREISLSQLGFGIATPVRQAFFTRAKFHLFDRPVGFVAGYKKVELVEEERDGRFIQNVKRYAQGVDKDGKSLGGYISGFGAVGRAALRVSSGLTIGDIGWIWKIPVPRPSILGWGLAGTMAVGAFGRVNEFETLTKPTDAVMNIYDKYVPAIPYLHRVTATYGGIVGGAAGGVIKGTNAFGILQASDDDGWAKVGGKFMGRRIFGTLPGAWEGVKLGFGAGGQTTNTSSPSTPKPDAPAGSKAPKAPADDRAIPKENNDGWDVKPQASLPQNKGNLTVAFENGIMASSGNRNIGTNLTSGETTATFAENALTAGLSPDSGASSGTKRSPDPRAPGTGLG